MRNHYRPSGSGKRYLAVALLVPFLLGAGVFVALERPSLLIPTAVTPPDTAQRSAKSEAYDYGPAPLPMPKIAQPSKEPVAPRLVGPGIFKCVEGNGAVTYSQYPCGQGSMIDTRPTSSGFAENWHITVKHRE